MPVVGVMAVREMLRVLVGVLVGGCIRPFSDGGLDEVLGFSVGLCGVGLGAGVFEA